MLHWHRLLGRRLIEQAITCWMAWMVPGELVFLIVLQFVLCLLCDVIHFSNIIIQELDQTDDHEQPANVPGSSSLSVWVSDSCCFSWIVFRFQTAWLCAHRWNQAEKHRPSACLLFIQYTWFVMSAGLSCFWCVICGTDGTCNSCHDMQICTNHISSHMTTHWEGANTSSWHKLTKTNP